MLGTTELFVETEQVPYPFGSTYYPMIRVFESPYTVGDCPVDEIVLNGIPADGTEYNRWAAFDDTAPRAEITSSSVRVNSLSDNDYEIDREYEIRIYTSDEVVDYEEEQTA